MSSSATSPECGASAVRCWAEAEAVGTGELCLAAPEWRHLNQVRRVPTGASVCVLNGRGVLGHGVLLGEGRVRIDRVERAARPSCRVTLVVGCAKQAALEAVLQKAVELGAWRVLVVQTEHSVVRLEPGKRERKQDRWRDLCVQACKQSANPFLPELLWSPSVGDALGRLPSARHLAAALDPAARPLREVCAGDPPGELALWVGPEGDFSGAEMEALRRAGAQMVGLGPRILRVETAAVLFLGAVQLGWALDKKSLCLPTAAPVGWEA